MVPTELSQIHSSSQFSREREPTPLGVDSNFPKEHGKDFLTDPRH